CTSDGTSVSAPGCCRMHRAYGWLNKQEKGMSPLDLLIAASEDANLSATLVIFFDQTTCTIKDLDLTICNLCAYGRKFFTDIIVADVTKPTRRTSRVLIDYIHSDHPDIPIIKIQADFTMDETYDKPTLVLRRIGRKVRSKYFFVISAGSTIRDANSVLSKLDEHLRLCRSRCVYWYFPKLHGDQTILVESKPIDGLYLTRPFQYLVDKSEKPFSKQLAELGEEQGLELSYLFDECVVISNNG
ncbi:hypothetical protein LCGC14_2725340, partial [marine sediment metagenome]